MLKQLEKLEREGTNLEKIKVYQERYERRVRKCLRKQCWVKVENINYLVDGKSTLDFDEFESYTPASKKKRLAKFKKKQKF